MDPIIWMPYMHNAWAPVNQGALPGRYMCLGALLQWLLNMSCNTQWLWLDISRQLAVTKSEMFLLGEWPTDPPWRGGWSALGLSYHHHVICILVKNYICSVQITQKTSVFNLSISLFTAVIVMSLPRIVSVIQNMLSIKFQTLTIYIYIYIYI